jgi:uncharacterized integral membrane protein
MNTTGDEVAYYKRSECRYIEIILGHLIYELMDVLTVQNFDHSLFNAFFMQCEMW